MFWWFLLFGILLWILWTLLSWRRRSDVTALPPHLVAFVKDAMQGATQVLDVHMHAVGMQPTLTGCCLHHTAWDKCPLPTKYLKALLFSYALGITDFAQSDKQAVDSLVKQLRFANKYCGYRGMLLAFDATYSAADGKKLTEKTSLEVPTSYVEGVCQAHPDLLMPCCSVHPYRSDAVQQLEACHSRGIRMVKWLPNSQFIDPAGPQCKPFYLKMAELKMILLCHVGEEHSVTTAGVVQSWGDPRRLRAALDEGVRVIMAHCASEGKSPDGIDYFNLFVAMMEEKKYTNLLFGDISATPAFLRTRYLKKLSRFPKIHSRIFYGSDYPVPCLPMVPLTLVHWYYGLITWKQRTLLNELYTYNTLLFNLVLLRIAFRDTSIRKPIGFSLMPMIALHRSMETE